MEEYESIGELDIYECDPSNIPVNCSLMEDADDDYPGKNWVWTANNFMPRKAYVHEGAYNIRAASKEVLIALVNKHVVPLYTAALHNLTATGESYYWEKTK